MPRRPRVSFLLVPLLLSLGVRPARAQSLSERLGGLLQFTGCELPLCLTVNGATQATHYTFRAALANSTALQFFTGAVGATLGTLPVSATSGSVSFRFVEGAPERVTTSAGPIFAERAAGLGRGRLMLNVNTTRIAFDHARGTNLRDVVFNFDHLDVGAPGLGDVPEEYDIMEVRPNIRLALQSTTVVATYGLTDRVDIGFALPVVTATLRATSTAMFVSPFGPISGQHLFGTDAAPTNTASAAIDGRYTGVGDLALRAKVVLRARDALGVSLLGDVRLPTGSRDNFAGTGGVAVRALGVVSGRVGDFSPHANVGLALRTAAAQNSTALLTAGFDQLLTRWATLAVDLISELQFRDTQYVIPIETRFRDGSVYPPTNVPDRRRDDPLNLSAGAKLLVRGTTLFTNVLLPLNDAGVRASRVLTAGVERSF